MKKRTIANVVMIAVIVVIVVAGVCGVGYIRGWFDRADETVAVLTDIRGVVNLEREGVIYPVESETVLRQGDTIIADPGAAAAIRMGDEYITLGSSAKVVVADPAVGNFSAEIGSGEVFANVKSAASLSFDGKEIVVSNAAVLISVRTGAQTVSVFSGTVEGAEAGSSISYIGDEVSVLPLELAALNDFAIDQIRTANQSAPLYFTNADLDQLVADRQQALQDAINGAEPNDPEPDDSQSVQPNDPEPSVTEDPQPADSAPEQSQPTQPDDPEPAVTEDPQPADSAPENTQPTQPDDPEPSVTEDPQPEDSAPEDSAPEESQPATQTPVGSCYITIRCDTVLNNMSDLNPAKAGYVPSSGVMLPTVEVDFYEGETVFDVLVRVCQRAGLQIEYSWTIFNNYYIEGIGHIYQKDCGPDSGWMFKVNEWFPDYGCSDYVVKNGDVIVFAYSCKGYGTDVGAPSWE